MTRLLLGTLVGAAGALVAGPLLNHAVLRWIGWRGVVPLLLGWEPRRTELGRPRAACRTCGAPLAPTAQLRAWARRARGRGRGARGGRDQHGRSDRSCDRRRAGDSWSGLPALGWLAIGGRCRGDGDRVGRWAAGIDVATGRGCRGCGDRVGRWAAGVEVATGLGFGVAAACTGWDADLLPLLVLVAGLVASAAVDLVCCRIPTRFVYLTGAGLAGAAGVAVLVDGEPGAVVGAVAGGATYLGVLGSLRLVGAGRMGLGDVRLGTLIGLMAGWVGWAPDRPVDGPLGVALLGLLLASLAASMVGLVLLVVRRGSRPYPFGPWLALGGLVAILTAV